MNRIDTESFLHDLSNHLQVLGLKIEMQEIYNPEVYNDLYPAFDKIISFLELYKYFQNIKHVKPDDVIRHIQNISRHKIDVQIAALAAEIFVEQAHLLLTLAKHADIKCVIDGRKIIFDTLQDSLRDMVVDAGWTCDDADGGVMCWR